MLHTVTEIAEEGLYLSHFRGFLKVSKGQEEKGRVPIDDVAVLMVTARGATLTKDLLLDLAVHDGITILCGDHFQPAAMVLPYGEHGETAGRIRDQIQASEPLNKNLWKQIVQLKIENQARVLEALLETLGAKVLKGYARQVKSGDSDNREAVAAQYYWPRLMGEGFKRRDEQQFANSFLNYGYAVLRGAAARAVCAAGLLPSWGLGHSNRDNAFCLADDLMEPFRPLVDLTVHQIVEEGFKEVTPLVKRRLARILQRDMRTSRGNTPVAVAMLDMAHSLQNSFSKKKAELFCAEILASEPEEPCQPI